MKGLIVTDDLTPMDEIEYDATSEHNRKLAYFSLEEHNERLRRELAEARSEVRSFLRDLDLSGVLDGPMVSRFDECNHPGLRWKVRQLWNLTAADQPND